MELRPQSNEYITDKLIDYGFKNTSPNEFNNSRILLHLMEPGECCIIQEIPADEASYLDIPRMKFVNWKKLHMILKAIYAI